MSGQGIEVSEIKGSKIFDKKKDNQRLRKIASYHFAAAMTALTLWGAGNIWAASSELVISEFTAVANALIAGIVLAFLAHEWGHFSAARLSGAFSPVLKDPVSFFMFNFKYEHNTSQQFIWMSLGGPAGNWLLVLLLILLVPLNTPSHALLLATTIGVAINVSVFELPIIKRTLAGGDPQQELQNQLNNKAPSIGRNSGIATGAILWLSYMLIY